MNPSRFSLQRLIDPASTDTLLEDARRGLFCVPKWFPSKHLYDEEGGRLFEEICTLEEYYPTRTERALLDGIADEVVGGLRPAALIELGSGSSTKTRLILEAMHRARGEATYVPIDVNEGLLEQSARALLEDYPWLSVRARVADFERPLRGLPRGEQVLVAFLGGTIGNFEAEPARAFLAGLREAVGPGASLLLGVDRVKDPRRIAAAYDDARGVTARFNLNLLRVLNRRLGADFDATDFSHRALYDPEAEQVEMHLVARRSLQVRLRALDLTARFAAGESVRTEISRKFTRESARALVERAGWSLRQVFSPPGEDFSLLWATAGPAAGARRDSGLASLPGFP